MSKSKKVPAKAVSPKKQTKPEVKAQKVAKPKSNATLKAAKVEKNTKSTKVTAAKKKVAPPKIDKKALKKSDKSVELKKKSVKEEVKLKNVKASVKPTKEAKDKPAKVLKEKVEKTAKTKLPKPGKKEKAVEAKVKSKKGKFLSDDDSEEIVPGGEDLELTELAEIEEVVEEVKENEAIPSIVIENDEDDEDFPKPKRGKKAKKDKAKKSKKVFIKNEIIVLGHRGNSGYFPENTMESITSCFNLPKVIGAEFDVQMTKDGDFVVFHDDDTSRFSENKLKIASATYSELKNMDVGSWFDPKYHQLRIPHLDDIMGALTHNNPNFFYNIEIKKSPFIQGESIKMYMNRLYTLVDSWVDPKRVLFTSFDWECLDYLKHHDQDVRIGVLTDQPDERGWISKVKQLSAEYIVIPMSKIDDEIMSIVKNDLETAVMGYTEFSYNQKEEELELVQKVKAYNISGLIVNYPEEVKAIVG